MISSQAFLRSMGRQLMAQHPESGALLSCSSFMCFTSDLLLEQRQTSCVRDLVWTIKYHLWQLSLFWQAQVEHIWAGCVLLQPVRLLHLSHVSYGLHRWNRAAVQVRLRVSTSHSSLMAQFFSLPLPHSQCLAHMKQMNYKPFYVSQRQNCACLFGVTGMKIPQLSGGTVVKQANNSNAGHQTEYELFVLVLTCWTPAESRISVLLQRTAKQKHGAVRGCATVSRECVGRGHVTTAVPTHRQVRHHGPRRHQHYPRGLCICFI